MDGAEGGACVGGFKFIRWRWQWADRWATFDVFMRGMCVGAFGGMVVEALGGGRGDCGGLLRLGGDDT